MAFYPSKLRDRLLVLSSTTEYIRKIHKGV
jgi:hypothetical protein